MSKVKFWEVKKESKVYNFLGKIVAKKEIREYVLKENYFQLKIKTEENEIVEVSVFQRKVSNEIWNEIVKNEYVDKRYLFSCKKLRNVLHLTDWKKINAN